MNKPATLRVAAFAWAMLAILVLDAFECLADESPRKSDNKTVTVIIDFGDRAKSKRFDKIPWREKMTVLDAMKATKKRSPKVRFEYRGSGATALLTKIDDVKNEGASGLNWIYRVNGKLGNRSFGVFKLKAHDTVQWKFGKYP